VTPPIIGLAGYARSGKDTVAGLLGRAGYERRAFADPLREAALALDPLIPTLSRPQRLSLIVARYGWEHAKTEFPEVRRTLQVLGTDVGRRIFGDNVWVALAFADLDETARVVFADVRFPNEARAIRARGGEVWRVERSGFGPINRHPSETALDDWRWDRVIRNDGTVDDLANAVTVALHTQVEVAG